MPRPSLLFGHDDGAAGRRDLVPEVVEHGGFLRGARVNLLNRLDVNGTPGGPVLGPKDGVRAVLRIAGVLSGKVDGERLSMLTEGSDAAHAEGLHEGADRPIRLKRGGRGIDERRARRHAVRTALALLLMLGLATVPPGLPSSPSGTVVLELEEGTWNQGAWDEAQSHGWDMLRLASWTRAVAWADGDEGMLEGVSVSVPAAISTSAFTDGDDVRLRFEPRLPEAATVRIANEANHLGARDLDLVPLLPVVQARAVKWIDGMEGLPGLQAVEPVMAVSARNDHGAGLLQEGDANGNVVWSWGFNGSGVVLGTADSGLDLDHACFRNGLNEVGLPGEAHRKVVVLNTTVHDADAPGQSDYRHGTHTAGTLACSPVAWNGTEPPGSGTALAHGARLAVADIVGPDGWAPPSFDALLGEAALAGAVVHSHSWGDDTTAYTARSAEVDLWSLEHPWTLAFIAPGNGGSVLEPANARNVVAVGATTLATPLERWVGSPSGPTEAGTDGIGLLAPGVGIMSAKADGLAASMNGDLRPSSGTSMATPMLASAAAVVQQMVEVGAVRGTDLPVSLQVDGLVTPAWSDASLDGGALLGEGWTPSGSLLRALLAASAVPLNASAAGGGSGHSGLSNPQDGWGQPQLDRLLNPRPLVGGGWDLAPTVWVHDSFRLLNGTPEDLLEDRLATVGGTGMLAADPWNGSGAVGPFLSEGGAFTVSLSVAQGQDLNVRLAFPASPGPAPVDDLVLRVTLDDGRVALAGVDDGSDSRLLQPEEADGTTEALPTSNETLRGVRIPAAELTGVSEVRIDVVARHVTPGNLPDHLGADGGRVGFALAVLGVERGAPSDGDEDGVIDAEDACPDRAAGTLDLDRDGCPDDSDGDGVVDDEDACPMDNASAADSDGDGCLDDSDNDGVQDPFDGCPNSPTDPVWPVNSTGCRPVDAPLRMDVAAFPEALASGVAFDVDVLLLDDDGDEARVEAFLSVDGLPMPETAVTVEGLGVVRLSWAAEAWAAPWLRNGSLVLVHLSASTLNGSPEAMASMLTPTTPVQSTYVEHVVALPGSPRAAPWPWALAASLGAALAAAALFGRREDGRLEDGPADPFRASSLHVDNEE